MPSAHSQDGGTTAESRWLLIMLLIAGVYLGLHLTRGWYPHDEGAMGQMAERVLHGEVPHRDFDEPYTGLLTYLHAGAFAVGGVRLTVLRIPLFAATMVWLVAVFAIARRSTGPAVAAGLALLSLAWSVPNYPASMPSWYNLFCATFGVLALFRWRETGATRWLVAAGLAGGVSFLFKLSGLFYVAGAMLFLVFVTREETAESGTPHRDRTAPMTITLGLAVFVALLWRAIAPYYQSRTIFHFVVPGALLALALATREWSRPAPNGAARLRALVRAGFPFLAGAGVPVLIFFGFFALAGGFPALLEGVFVTPFRRLAFANMRPPAPYWALAAVPLVVLLRPRRDVDDPKWRRMAVLVAVLLGLVLMLAYTDSFPHRFVWQSVRSLAPLLALAGAAVVAWPQLTRQWRPMARERFVMLVMVAALSSLVQFPFSSPTYFLYVAPLCLLALVLLLAGAGRTPHSLAMATAEFYGLFALLLVTPGAVVGLGFRYETSHETVRLALARAGLRVRPDDAALYGELIPQVQRRAAGGEIWAGPDSPEVYFLSGFRNRTRAIFDFLGGETGGLQSQADGPDVRVVVLNTRPSFSRPLAAPVLEMLRRRFPAADTIGRFELRWRE
jgi:peptidoglycan/LPS O-acetylase OafA/YrhL